MSGILIPPGRNSSNTLSRSSKTRNHTLDYCSYDDGNIVPHRPATPADTSPFLQHQDWGAPCTQMGFLPAFVLHSTSRTTSSAKKTGKSCAEGILSTDPVPQTMLWFTVWQHLTWTVTLTPEDQIWLLSPRSWLSFLKTSVQPPFRINKTLHSGEGAGILVLLFWLCGCQEIKPGTLRPFRAHSWRIFQPHLDEIELWFAEEGLDWAAGEAPESTDSSKLHCPSLSLSPQTAYKYWIHSWINLVRQ